MSRKNYKFVTRVQGADGLRRKTERMTADGYEMYMPSSVRSISESIRSWDDEVSAQLRNGGKEDGRKSRSTVPTLFFSSGNEQIAGTDGIGTEQLGYIEWGDGNVLPNVVGVLTGMLPYTAAGIKFNTDICAGLGPRPMYSYSSYIGGNVSRSVIDYQDAGVLLRGKLIDKQRELIRIQNEKKQNEEQKEETPDLMAVATGLVQPSKRLQSSPYDDIIATLKDEIASLKEDYEVWQTTNAEVEQFLSRNNLQQVWLSLANDEMMFNICFPELQLNQQDVDKDGKPVNTQSWNPKVTGIAYRSCHTTRLEKMDDHGVINYVYCSNRWLDKAFVDQSEKENEITAVRALNVQSPLQSLEADVRVARQRNLKPANRPTRFVLPSYYPTAGRPYYPTPAWHSIFGGDIYEYLSTIISDRFSRKKNSSIIGRVIYLNKEYLESLFNQAGAMGDKKKMDEIRTKCFQDINAWLSNRDNAGQSLIAFTFTGSDAKEHKSFEIVEIESNSKNSVAANEKETAEISSVVFMALGLDARLLGSTPLSLIGNGSGTDIRERLLMRQILMSPTTNVMMKCLEVVSKFNHWDSHLEWRIKREVMTTLDRSKSGVSEDIDNK